MCVVLVGIYIYEKTVKKKYSIIIIVLIGGQTEYNSVLPSKTNNIYSSK